jgi:hypothetical protein
MELLSHFCCYNLINIYIHVHQLSNFTTAVAPHIDLIMH